MRAERFSMKWILALVALLATALVIAGCGGGGGGGGGTTGGGTGTKTYSYSGVVVDQDNNPLVGYKVGFDSTTYFATTTAPSGAFNIAAVPSTSITGNDKLVIFDANGNQFGSYTLPAGTLGASGLVITAGPPSPPSLYRPHH